ncbi:uncharacterized protein KRP23_4323 [Phytophthora ramorum]|uniref:uncharacterized protein n=1 Tax=Phytophthora ramorum TaxID=164328 RepID=UPI0030A4932E|nr:hypothetical protein KRP23_4323 [Phytophthora ramorum]
MKPAEPSTPTRDWAASTAASWAKEVEEEMRLQRRRQCIARCRARTKLELQQMHQERERLEQQVKQQLAALSEGIAKRVNDDDQSAGISDEIYQLALESDALRTEALAIRNQLQQYNRCWSLVHEAAVDWGLSSEEPSSSLPVREASKASKWVSRPPLDESGWQVYFQDESSSFYFHPFTRKEFDDILKRCDDTLVQDPPRIEVAGSLFGWTVHRAPLTRRTGDGSLVSHVRFTTRVSCSLDALDASLIDTNLQSWPLVVTPPSWGYNERKQASCQVLQVFEADEYVIVHDIPGPLRYRYICLVRRLPGTSRFGERTITYAMVLADSKGDARNHASYQRHHDIEWVKEGGGYVRFTEINANTIDVRYDHWASCQDELHAQHLFVRWAQFNIGWSQTMSTNRLIPEN